MFVVLLYGRSPMSDEQEGHIQDTVTHMQRRLLKSRDE